MVKVSIIVPVYNVEQYLERCINSLLNQSLKEIEIIFVNDASPDNSMKILNSYKKKYPKKISVINSAQNLKQGGAKNLGLTKAQGEYIGFVDSDDWVTTDMFEKLYNQAIKNDSDIVDSDLYIAKDINNVIGIEEGISRKQLNYSGKNSEKKYILHSGRMVTKIFKRELFINNNIRFPENVFYEDNEIIPLLMISAKKISKVDEPLYFYFRKNGQSTTTQMDSYHHFDRLKTSENMISNFYERGLYEKYKDELDYRFIELYYLNTIHLCLTRFTVPELDYLKYIRNYMRKNFPTYRDNKYFNSNTSYEKKVISKLNDLSPKFLTSVYQVTNQLFPLKTIRNVGKRIIK